MFTPISFTGKIFRAYLRSFQHPAKIRIQNAIGRKCFSRGILFKHSDGTIYQLDANDWITRIFLLEGNYESGSVMLAKNIMKAGGTFVDVGTNFGLFTCQVPNNNNKAIKIISVEPNYKIISSLLNNIELNGLQQQVRVLNMAVSDKTQFVTMQQPAADNVGTTKTVAGISGELAVLSSTLSFIFEEQELNVVDLLKIDIEGNEFSILKDFPFDRFLIKNIILEFNHLSTISFEELRLFFEEKGFRSFTIDARPLTDAQQEIKEHNIWFVNQRS